MNPKRKKVRMSGSCRPVLVLMITLVSLMSSCVDGDLYDLYDEDSELLFKASRRKNTKDVNNDGHLYNASGVPFFEISENIFHSTGCFVNALDESLPISKKKINNAIESAGGNTSSFDLQYLGDVFNNLNIIQNQYTVSYSNVSANSLAVGDIAFTNVPLSLNVNGSSQTLQSSSGHCFVVDEVINASDTQYYFDTDSFLYCKMDKSYFQGGIRITYVAR